MPSGAYDQSLLRPAGPQARELYEVLTFDLLAVALLWVLMVSLVIYAVTRFRRRREEEGLPPQVEGNPKLELGWTIALILGMGVLALHPVKAEFDFEALPREGMEVEVIGHQYWWEFRYPEQGIVTANELHIPVGVPVRLKMTSADVIHSLNIPRLGGKNDAIPGRITWMWLQADEPGVYQGQCFELCGASHARMLARAIAHPREEFEAWVKRHQNPVTKPATPLAQEGEKIFATRCASCHTVDGTPYQGKVGPNLTGFGERTVLGGGISPNTRENVLLWLSDPAELKPGALMPNLGLSQEEKEALVEYLEGLK